MNLQSNWKGFYSSSDNQCYDLTDHHSGGFFACVFSALSSIVEAYNSCKILPKDINIDKCLSMSCEESQNLYNFFFEAQDSIDVHASLSIFSSLKQNRYRVPIVFASRPFKEQNYNAISPIWNKYFTPNQRIKSLRDDLISKYKIDINKTLGVYYRGTDKIKEERLPSYEEYINKVQLKASEGSFERIFIQTDEEEFKDLFLASVDNSFYINELGFSNEGDGVHRELRKKGIGQTKNSEYMLAVVYIFSELHSLIVNTSHVSHAMCLYRNNTNNVFQYRRGKWIS
jgi:hypothetical protein